ncbi:UNVERIFIED_CONTAM: hypothetical protein FKN15_053087 [Acipenser sinensis]
MYKGFCSLANNDKLMHKCENPLHSRETLKIVKNREFHRSTLLYQKQCEIAYPTRMTPGPDQGTKSPGKMVVIDQTKGLETSRVACHDLRIMLRRSGLQDCIRVNTHFRRFALSKPDVSNQK